MSNTKVEGSLPLRELDISLKSDIFLRSFLAHLTGTLEGAVGLEDAEGFISVVGSLIGEEINQCYREALGLEKFSQEQIADVLIDLKRRIGGSFFVIEQTEEKIVFGNHTCPLGEQVQGHPSLCMMTSNVFGLVTAQSLGYAKVVIPKAIANYDAGCRVIVYLKPTPEALATDGREYHQV